MLPILILIMKIKCKKCNYEWETKSKLWTVSCPSCGTKNEIKNNNIKNLNDFENLKEGKSATKAV